MSDNTYWNEEFFPNSANYICPPEIASSYTGNLFRFTNKNNEVSTTDYKLVSSRASFRNRYQNEHYLLCQGSGLSSYKCEEAAISAHKKASANSNGFRKRFKGIYKIELSEDDGVVALTPSNNSKKHCTWWVVGSEEDLLSRSEFVKRI